MDPVTIVGLAAAVVSFVDIGSKVCKHVMKAYLSPQTCSSASDTVRLLTEELNKSMGRIRALQGLVPNESYVDDGYELLIDECSSIRREILTDLNKISPAQSSGKLASVKKIIAIKPAEKRIEENMRRLSLVQDAINL